MSNHELSTRAGNRRAAIVSSGIALAVMLAACSSSGDDGASTSEPAVADEAGAPSADGELVRSERLTADGLTVSAAVTDTNVLGAEVTIESPDPVAVQITATADDHVVQTPLTAASEDRHSLPLVGLRADRNYEVQVDGYDENGSLVRAATTEVTTGALPDFVADYELAVAEPGMQPGLTLVEAVPSNDESGHVVAIDEDGEVVWYHRDTSSVSAVDLQDTGTFLGLVYPFSFVEFDVLGAPLRRWEFATASGGAATSEPGRSDTVELDIPWSVGSNGPGTVAHSPHHEITLLPDGNLLGLARVPHAVSTEFQREMCPDSEVEWAVASDLVVEFEPDGTVVRTWDVADAIDIEDNPGVHLCVETGIFATPTERDWSHANAAVYDEETDTVLVSVRHTDSVVAFEHGESTGHQSDVAWILGTGGTVPIDGEPFYHQHAPEVQDDGSLLIYDNGNFRPDGSEYSRAVLYEFDSTWGSDQRAVQTWEHRVDDVSGGALYAPFLGDADRLANGNVLITHGGIGGPQGDVQQARIIEVVPEGSAGGAIVFDLRLGDEQLGYSSYRADRIDTLYTGPLWQR